MVSWCTLVCLLGVLTVTAAGCKLDLGFVVDKTKSIEEVNIPKLKRTLKLLVQQFDISENGTHVSLETFDKTDTLHNKFSDSNYYSEGAVFTLIDDSINTLAKPTRLDYAIQTAKEEMFTKESGDRPGVLSVMVLLTDGKSHPKTDVAGYMKDIKDIKSKGVRFVVIVIGPKAKEEEYRKALDATAGKELFFIDDYDELEETVANLTAFICPPKPCEVDLAFLVDKTDSVEEDNFKLVKGFLMEVSNALTIGPDATHTAFILFAEKAQVLNTFADSEYYSNQNVQHLIENIPVKLGSRTFIDLALEAAADEMYTEEGGDRPDFPNLLILITDGRTNPNSEPFSNILPSLQAKEVKIVAIRVGNYEEFLDQLEEKQNVFTLNDFEDLSDVFHKILEETCKPYEHNAKRRLPHPKKKGNRGYITQYNPKIVRTKNHDAME